MTVQFSWYTFSSHVLRSKVTSPKIIRSFLHRRVVMKSPCNVSELKTFLNLWLWWQFIKSTASNIKKAKVNYCLGFTACLLVVFVVAVLVTLLSKSPLVFLRLSELNNGEMDAAIMAGDWTGYEYINYSAFSKEIMANTGYQHHTPRRLDTAQLYFGLECSTLNASDAKWKYFPLNESDFCGFSTELRRCFNKHCPAFAHAVGHVNGNSNLF